MKKTLSFVLILALVFSIGIPAFAAAEEDEDSISVACIGDSIANGCSLYYNCTMACATPSTAPYTGNTAYQDLRDQYKYLINYNDSLPADDPANLAVTQEYEKTLLNVYGLQVAMGLNLDDEQIAEIDTFDEFRAAVDYRSLTANAMRSSDILTLFDEEYKAELESEGYDYCWYNPEVESIHRLFTKEYVTDCICGTEDTEPVDVLIYALGNNDFIYGPLVNASYADSEDYTDVLLSEIAEGLVDYTINTPKILDILQELNPDMEIVLVGVYNPYLNNDLSSLNLSLSEDATTLVLDALSGAVATINTVLRTEADTRDNVTFVDVNGLLPAEYDEAGNLLSGDGVHPSAKGHSYIASRILSAIPASIKEKNKYDISVNLFGAYDPDSPNSGISSVTVNGKAVTDYELDGYTLTIHYKNAGAKVVNVVTKGDTVGSTTWQASYNLTDGYRTYQLFKSSDVSTTVSKVANKGISIGKSIVGTLFSFNK